MATVSVHRVAAAAAIILSTALTPLANAAESLQLVEQEIKAGLLYNFLKYTDWPQASDPNQPFVVCLLGGDPLAGRLQPMAGRTVNQHTIEIRSVGAVSEVEPCLILFVNANQKPQWPALHTALTAKPLLTVSDFAGFSDAGGMIEFTRVDNRMGVKINTNALAAAHLQVQDRLLKLASAARGGSGR